MKKEPGVCVNHLVVKIKDYVVQEFNDIQKFDQGILEAKCQQHFEKLEDIERF